MRRRDFYNSQGRREPGNTEPPPQKPPPVINRPMIDLSYLKKKKKEKPPPAGRGMCRFCRKHIGTGIYQHEIHCEIKWAQQE